MHLSNCFHIYVDGIGNSALKLDWNGSFFRTVLIQIKITIRHSEIECNSWNLEIKYVSQFNQSFDEQERRRNSSINLINWFLLQKRDLIKTTLFNQQNAWSFLIITIQLILRGDRPTFVGKFILNSCDIWIE